jgi:hypothetical protein
MIDRLLWGEERLDSGTRRQLETGQVRAAGGTGHHQVRDTNTTKDSITAAALDGTELSNRPG